jgi:hypothetical protein
MVGPFAFFNAFGPAVFRAGEGVDTRPHPHIGLATLTYLIEGEMDHRDSEGYVQTIRPGKVNLMTAGADHGKRKQLIKPVCKQLIKPVCGFKSMKPPIPRSEVSRSCTPCVKVRRRSSNMMEASWEKCV